MMRGRGCVTRSAAALITMLTVAVWTAGPASSLSPAGATPTGARNLAAQEADFPAYMHDAAHSGFSPATAIGSASTLHLSHVFQEKRIANQPKPEFIATPLVIQHVIYIGSNTGEFY